MIEKIYFYIGSSVGILVGLLQVFKPLYHWLKKPEINFRILYDEYNFVARKKEERFKFSFEIYNKDTKDITFDSINIVPIGELGTIVHRRRLLSFTKWASLGVKAKTIKARNKKKFSLYFTGKLEINCPLDFFIILEDSEGEKYEAIFRFTPGDDEIAKSPYVQIGKFQLIKKLRRRK